MGSLYFFISSLINSTIFLRPFYKNIRNERKFIYYFYPLLFYYLTLFILSPLSFIVNILNRVIVFPYEGLIILLIGLYFRFITLTKVKRLNKEGIEIKWKLNKIKFFIDFLFRFTKNFKNIKWI